MTHEELLAQIQHYGKLESLMAGILEEVANLHEPIIRNYLPDICELCEVEYPCATIKKIWEML